MNLENAVKYHFAKSSQINDTPRSTSSETLTGTDVMAAMGLTQNRAAMGCSAFLGKMGISKHDSERAITLLTEHALKHCDKVAALRKLESDIKPKVMQILAIYAYADYSRSAASTRECDCCSGAGFIDAEVFTMKTSGWGWREIKETARVLCHKCKGKGVISTACSDCKGRGKSMDEKLTKEQGVPVIANCKRCNGRGYERIPSTDAHNAICEITESISLDTWKKSVKSFYDDLSLELDIQEAYADRALKTATQ
ncbi:Antitermination protein [Cedecea lapagei]|uniref:Antitermination protein n=1 Tax=Cedecea lapagei TaxID=158823 RepID=A0A3S4IJV9_9ENTR|nr:antitermination protein [Cedecea lapagei]VEB99984.1 Antitermination protein [Cedecea lapagei]